MDEETKQSITPQEETNTKLDSTNTNINPNQTIAIQDNNQPKEDQLTVATNTEPNKVDSSPANKPGSSKKLIIIIVAILLGLIIIGFAVFFVLSSGSSSSPNQSNNTPTNLQQLHQVHHLHRLRIFHLLAILKRFNTYPYYKMLGYRNNIPILILIKLNRTLISTILALLTTMI